MRVPGYKFIKFSPKTAEIEKNLVARGRLLGPPPLGSTTALKISGRHMFSTEPKYIVSLNPRMKTTVFNNRILYKFVKLGYSNLGKARISEQTKTID